MKIHTFNSDELPLRAELALAGVRCALTTNSREILSCVSHWVPEASNQRGNSIDLEIFADSSISRELPAKAHFRGLKHLVFAAFGTQEIFTFDLMRKRVIGVVSLATARDAAFWNERLLPILVGVMGITVGVIPLHSACLDRDGKALLIAGHSGAGKSTLSVALAQRGYSLVSDDWIYVSKDSEGADLIASGMSVPVKLLPDAVRHFPELQKLTPKESLNGELAFEVDATDVFSSQLKQTSRPHWLMFLERDNRAGCDFSPCSAEDAEAFYECSAELLPEELHEAAWKRTEIIRAVSSRECYRVRSGESPQKTAEAIELFCENA